MQRHAHETTVIGVFDTSQHAQSALQALDQLHLEDEDVRYLPTVDAYQRETMLPLPAGDQLHEESIHAGKIGSIAGAIVAAAAAITGVISSGGSALAAIPLALVSGGAGGMLGSIIGSGFVESEAEWVDKEIRLGHKAVLIHAKNHRVASEVKQLLKARGSLDVHSYH